MDFVSIRIITGDVARLVEFYERVTGVRAEWATAEFAELRTSRATLAIAGERTVPLFAEGSARPADNHSVITEFLVDDVDRLYENLTGSAPDSAPGSVAEPLPGSVPEFVQEPTTMPWGNRSLLLRDPDGNLVNFFTPVTPAAIEKFGKVIPD
jgi:catechol 2,3-dioxygenase-like lactoylglutathione lyase family enzyme